MTQDTATLLPLLHHVERQRDQALAALAQADDALRRLQQQAEQLQAYRTESLRRHPALGGRSAAIELLRCHEGFMQRLDQAIAQQRTQCRAADARIAARRAELLTLELRVAGVRKLLERRVAEVRQRVARQEQRRQDDAVRAPSHTHAQPRATQHDDAPGWRASTRAAPLTQ